MMPMSRYKLWYVPADPVPMGGDERDSTALITMLLLFLCYCSANPIPILHL